MVENSRFGVGKEPNVSKRLIRGGTPSKCLFRPETNFVELPTLHVLSGLTLLADRELFISYRDILQSYNYANRKAGKARCEELVVRSNMVPSLWRGAFEIHRWCNLNVLSIVLDFISLNLVCKSDACSERFRVSRRNVRVTVYVDPKGQPSCWKSPSG